MQNHICILAFFFIDLYSCTYMFSVLQVFSYHMIDVILLDTDVSPLHTSGGADELLSG